MPVFAREFSLSPASAALALSVATLTMAPALVVAGSASEVFGRKRMMVVSLAASALASLAAATAHEWNVFLVLRALTGMALSGLPAVAMAYLADEIDPPALGLAMGLYIAGSTLGGMAGRLIVAVLADRYGWRVAVASLGVEGLLGALLFLIALPRERRRGERPDLARLFQMLAGHFSDPGLRLLYAEGSWSIITSLNAISRSTWYTASDRSSSVKAMDINMITLARSPEYIHDTLTSLFASDWDGGVVSHDEFPKNTSVVRSLVVLIGSFFAKKSANPPSIPQNPWRKRQ